MRRKTPRNTLYLAFVWIITAASFGISLATFTSSDEDTFTIQHSATGKCLVAEHPEVLDLASCDSSSSSHQWKWGSGRHLYHVATSLCLGLELRTKTLALLDCGSNNLMWWLCRDSTIYTVYQMGLVVSNGKAVAKRDGNDAWVRGGSQENICQGSHHLVHTTSGNSLGDPCVFPFLFNSSWHHGCLPDQDSPGMSWCSTTLNYDQDRKKGYCLTPEEGCQTLFEGPEGDSCYEFVPSAAVSWQEALDSCRSQGADLLSVSGPKDLHSKTLLDGLERMPNVMWIGLHQLDTSAGWQWADGSPLVMLRWEEGMPAASTIEESDCGILNSNQRFESESCSKRLPYICKKKVNGSQTATESSAYKDTVCADGWVPWDGWCYKLVKDEPQNFTEALLYCNDTERGGGGSLASLHSVDTKEMINTNFHAGAQLLDVWIGLVGSGENPTVFKWVDREPVTFTYWDKNQPVQPTQDPSCVFYTGESHGWRVGDCALKLPFMCQKKGEIKEMTSEPRCRFEDGWRRHGNSCYQVNSKKVSFEDQCHITIRNRFEQAFISRLLVEQISSETQYYWIGLQDVKNTGEYSWHSWNGSQDAVSYTNWGFYEPRRYGGCAVMSTAKPLGKWEVKNCTIFKAGTICRKDLSPPPPLAPEPNASIPCPNGWVSRENVKYCYKVFHEERLTRKRSWEEAEKFCEALGATLPSFTNLDEMRSLHFIARDVISNNRFFWVGLNRRDPSDRSWRWSDGRPVSMSILQQDFHEDDAYNRECTAFKTMRNSLQYMLVFLLHDLPPMPFFATPFHCDAQLEWICQIPRGRTPKTPPWYSPAGYHETSEFVDGREFWFVRDPELTYQEAELFCNTHEGRLVAPASFIFARKIHEYISKVSTSSKQSWWADMKEPGRLFPMTYSQLQFYHSVLLGRCTSISPESLFPEYQFGCHRRLPFVCERLNATLVERNPLEPQPDGTSCATGYMAFRNKCYTVIKYSLHLTFSHANEECQSLRGTLVTISDQVEQDFITTLLPTMENADKIWIGLKLTPANPEWIDKSPVSFLNFNPLFHDILGPVKNMFPSNMDVCVYLINNPKSAVMGTWAFSYCSELNHMAVCQHYADTVEEPSVVLQPFDVNNHTVLLLLNNLTWFEALEQCQNQNMDLVSVTDVFLQATLTVHVSRARTPMWIGLFSEDDGIHFRWTDHSHTVFSRWSSEASSGSCVYLDTDGFWKATECQDQLGGAICHKSHEVIITTPEDAAIKCPHKINGPVWIPFKRNCYSLQLVTSRWEEFNDGRVHDTCRKLDENADILTIRNEEENEFVTKQLVPLKDLVQFVWLGLFIDDLDEMKKMKWFDGTYVQFSNWRNGRPDIEGEFMAGINADGVWELISNKRLFYAFQRRAIVVCKLDNEPKKNYSQSSEDLLKYGTIKYQVVRQKLNWFQALEACDQRGGHLASVHDVQHHAHVELLAKTDGFPLWIGLSNQYVSGSSYEWSDGTSYDHQSVISAATDEQQPSCVYVSPTGGWVRTSCHKVVEGAICYSTTITTSKQRAKLQVVPQRSNCPESGGVNTWVQHEDHCYVFDNGFYNYSVYTMEQARSVCQRIGAKVMTINTKEENDFVSQYVSDNPLITRRVWLGMDSDAEAWEDGSALSFSNWKSGNSTPGKTPASRCAVMSDGGAWNLVDCKETYSRAVCKMEASSAGSPVAVGFFVVVVLALVAALAFIIYKKKRGRFSSTVRYKRTFDDSDATSIITAAE